MSIICWKEKEGGKKKINKNVEYKKKKMMNYIPKYSLPIVWGLSVR